MPRSVRKRNAVLKKSISSQIEMLECRRLLSTITWTGDAGDNNWTTGTNWQGNIAPGAGDEALINIGGPGITFSDSNQTVSVGSIVTDQNINIAAGTLAVGTSTNAGAVQLDSATITMKGGMLQYADVTGTGSIVLTNSGGTLDTVTAGVNIDGTSNGSYPSVTILNSLVLDNSALEIGATTGSYYATVYLGAPSKAAANISVSSGATGEVRFGASINNGLIDDSTLTTSSGDVTFYSSAGAPLTIDGGGGAITQEYETANTFTNQGTINETGGGTLSLDYNWINSGTIEATNGTLGISSFTNTGSLTASGANGILILGGANTPNTWSNTGTITLTNSATLNLGGSFTLSGVDLGNFHRDTGATAGTLNLTGTMNASGSTLALDPSTTGNLNLDGGDLQNVTLQENNGAQLLFTNNGGTLDTLITQGNLNVSMSTNYPRVTILNSLTLDNAVLEIGSSSTTYYGTVFLGSPSASPASISVTSGATGEILFGGSINNGLIDDSNLTGSSGNVTFYSSVNAPLTIDGTSGAITQEYQTGDTFTNQATINEDGGGTLSLDDGWVNSGTIEATNGNLSIASFTNTGNLIANGASASLTLGGTSNPDTWSNNGAIALDAGTLNFGGSFSLTGIGTFNRSGGTAGTVNLTGTLAGGGGTLTLDPTTIGSWNLDGGDIQNLTLVEDSTAQLLFTNAGGTLDTVTTEGNLNVSLPTAYPHVTILNSLTLDNAVLEIGSSSTTYYADIYLGSPSVSPASILVTNGATGEIRFGASINNSLLNDSNLTGSSGTATFYSSVTAPLTIDGASGSIVQEYQTSDLFVNQATINDNVSGGSLHLADTWTNPGTIEVTNGGSLGIDSFTNTGNLIANGGTLTLGNTNTPNTWSSTGTITVTNSATLNMGGSFTLAGLDLPNFHRDTGATAGTVNLTGTLNANGGTLTLDPSTTGSWNLVGGDLQNATLQETNGAQMLFTSSGGSFDTVTADNDLDVALSAGYPRLTILNSLTLHNAVLDIGEPTGSYYADVYLGTPAVAAANIYVAPGTTGEIRFGSSINNSLVDNSNLTTANGDVTLYSSPDAPLTIDGISGSISQEYQTANIFTNQATINSNGGGSIHLSSNWINSGTMEAANGTLAIDSFTNNGSIIVIGGASVLTLGAYSDPWSNAGTITLASGATVNLGGTFTPTGLGLFTRSDGTVNLIGTLNLNNSVLNLTAALGSWNLKGCTIENGTITMSGGAELIGQDTTNILNSVTLNGTLDLSQAYSDQATVEGGLVLNGSILIGNSAGNTYGELYFGAYNVGAGSITGAGTVSMGPSISNLFYNNSHLAGSMTLVVGPNITINASSGTVGSAYTGAAIIDEGTLNVFGQGTLSIPQTFKLGQTGAATGTLNVAPTATVNFNAGGITGASTNFAASDAAGSIQFVGGTSTSPQMLEAMSQDLGDVNAGFTNNFVYGTLTVTSDGYVRLVDQSNNTGGTKPEAVYTDSLLVNSGSTLDLNGLNLYTRASQISGTVINGTITQLPNAGALTMNTPTPGKLSTAGELDQWSFFERGGQQVSIVVNPGSSSSLPAPISPALGYAKVELLDANNNVLGSSSGGYDQLVTISDVTLPADGTYKIEIKASTVNTGATGNYIVAAYDVTPNVQALTLNENQVGNIGTAFGIDQWNFSGGAGQQIRFNLLNETASGLEYSLAGPNGYTAFSDASGSSGLIDLPSSGNYTLSVSGINGQTGQYAFNISQTAQAALTLGSVYDGTFQASGQAQLFTVQVTVSQPLSITLNDLASTDHTELYAKLGAPPTLLTYDDGDSSSGSSHTLLVPDATIGTWYILVYGESISAPPQAYTLRATSGEVIITKSEPASSAANLATTLTINGAGFNGGSRVTLVSDPAGMTIPASSASLDLPTQITATFNAGTLPAGTYSVVVTQADNTSDTLTDALTVAAGGQATLTTSIVLPNPIGYHISSVLYVNYANTGTVAMPAPLLIFTAYQDGQQGALMTLNPALQTAGFWTTTTPAGFSQTVEILASGATPGVLEPGESAQVPVYYDGWLNNLWDFSRPPITFSISSIQADNTQSINWTSQQTALKPTGISTATWNSIYGNLESQVGTTGGSYVQMLDSEAAYLGRLGEDVDDVSSLWAFAVEQSDGDISPVGPTLTSATDDTLAMPGSLSFSMDREFATSISGRNELGPFGVGWSTSWDTSLLTESDGTVVVSGENGSQRIYEPDSRTLGAFFSQPGDYSTLTAVGGGFKLAEPDGSFTFYNTNGTLGYIEDANGNKITAGYNGNGQLTTLTASTGGTMTLAYNANGLISSVTDSVGRETTYAYDASNHLTSVTGYGGQTTSYSYNPDNSLASISYPGNTHQYYTYDSQGRLSTEYVDGNQEKVAYSYNQGEVTATDALGNASSRYFDADGLLVKSVDALGNTTFATYDANFDLIKLTDANGQTERFTYDANGNLTSSTDELGATTTYTYSGSLNRLSSSTDANGNTTSYAYNSAGNLTSVTYANGSTDTTTYDAEGDALSFTNPSSQMTTYTYNSAGQITKETFADGTSTTLAYDSRGRLATATNAAGAITFTYNTADQLTEVAYPNGQSLSFTYNAAGERTQMVDNTGYTINYSYDSAGRLSELTDGSDNPIVTYTYDAVGRLSKKTNGNGTYTSYTYDADGNVVDLINYAANSSIQSSFVYTYNAVGERTTETTTAGTWTYTYNAAGELTLAVYVLTGQSNPSQSLAYSYDPVGNLTQTIINGVTTVYVVNDVNEYTSVGGIAYAYDANGNLTSDGTNTYTYNDLGQLTGVSNIAGTTTYTYDALGNENSVTAGGMTTNYLIDPTGQANVVAEFNGSTLLSHSIFGLGLAAEVTANSNVYYYGFDATGSTAQLTNAAGSVVDSYSYLPFGSLLSSSVTVANPFEFTGQVGDLTDGTGLISMRARDYSPTLNRFLTPDPAGAGTNPYQYALNNPISYIDPTGLLPIGTAIEKLHLFANLSALLKTIIKIIPSHPVHGGVVSIVGAIGKSTSTSPAPQGNNDPYNDPNDDPDDNDNSDDDNSDDDDNNLDNTDNNDNNSNDDNPDNNNNDGPDDPDNPDDPGDDPDPGPGDPGPGGSSSSVTSHDPNLKTGPAGYGTENFVQETDASVFPYTVEFENAGPGSKDANGNPLPESDWATAPAQQVTITDQLSSDLNWSTFQLTQITFGGNTISIPAGSQQYQTEVSMTYLGVTFEVEMQAGIHTATGVVYADFYSIDPDTDLPPSNPLIGFLPPEDGTGRGVGTFSYTVDPNLGLASGTQINNVATITFDTNPAITTDQANDEDASQGIDPSKEATVTIDNAPPTSSVTVLPADEAATTFPVSWSGSDGSGSGIASYSIYVSDNGGSFIPWLTDTTQTTADYTGTIGHTYGFYSTATDNVGNAEAAHVSADTQTTLTQNTMTPVVSAGGNQTIKGLTLSRGGSFADSDAGDSWTATVNYGDGTSSQPLTLNSDKTFTLSHAYAQDGVYTVSINVVDAADHDGSATFTVTMDSTPPAATLNNVSTATSGGSSVTFSVTYTDANGVDGTTLGGGAVTVTLPGGSSVTANLQNQTGSGSSITATYAMNAPNGTFSTSDNGTYTIKLTAGSVKDVPGNAVAAQTLGTFVVALSGAATPPVPALTTAPSPSAGNTTVQFTVTYSDNVNISTSTLGSGNIVVNDPDGNTLQATFVSQSTVNGSIVAVYSIAAPGGSFDAADNGLYTIAVGPNPVQNADDQSASGTVGTFTVAISGSADTTPPTATVASVATPTIDTTTLSFVVNFSDDVSLNTASIATGDITVTGPNGFSQVASLISGPTASSASAATATFQITAPGGYFTDAANGSYIILLNANTLLDSAGNAAAAGTIGSFTANIAVPGNLPDLSGSISTVPSTVLPLSKKNTVVLNIANTGSKALKGNVPFTLYAYTGGTFNASSATLLSSGTLKVNLNAKGTKTFSESFVAPTSIATGDYHIVAVLDPHDTVQEQYKSNNTLISAGTAHFEAPTADLGIALTTPGSISTAKKSKVAVTVTNHGNVAATGSGTIRLYASSDQSDLQTLIGTLPSKFSLKAGAGKKYSVSVANDVALKGEEEYLIAVVSYSGSPADDDAGNNTVFSNVKVSFT